MAERQLKQNRDGILRTKLSKKLFRVIIKNKNNIKKWKQTNVYITITLLYT